MRRKFFSWLLLGTLALGTLTACGGGEVEDGDDNGSEQIEDGEEGGDD